MTEEIRCICRPLPGGVNGFTVKKNGYYTIVLREDLDPEGRLRTYQHEVEHIRNCDCGSGESVDGIETRLHE